MALGSFMLRGLKIMRAPECLHAHLLHPLEGLHVREDKCPEPKGWGDNGEVPCMGFQVFSIWGSHRKAVVQIRPALKSSPPDASDGDGRKGRREKGRLIWP